MQILLIEEDTVSAELAREKFLQQQHQVQVATSIAAGEILFCSKKFDVILCGAKLPDGNGLDFWNFCRYAKVGRYRFPFFIFTMNNQDEKTDYSNYWEQLWFGATAIIPHCSFDTKLWNLLKSLATNQNHQQYRMQPRLEIHGDIDFVFENKLMNAKIKNISTRGMLIEMHEPLIVGTSIKVASSLRSKDLVLEQSIWQVRWSQSHEEGKYLIGLYLQDVEKDQKIQWCEKINEMILAA